MNSPVPINTSTPTLVPRLHGRQSYKDSSFFSPIETMKNNKLKIDGISILTSESSIQINKKKLMIPEKHRQEAEEDSQTGTDDSSDISIDNERQNHEPEDGHEINSSPDQSSTNKMYIYQYGLVILIFGIIVSVVALKGESEDLCLPTVTINTLKETFPQQDEKFWTFIKSGVMEITNFEKPTVIIFMHKEGASNVSELLYNITTYASCIINNNCLVDPIVLKGQDLNTPELIEDYGILIDNYSSLLEEKRILVVKNIDEVLGSVAQAFHYICDEYAPLVKKSLIIFTIQVNEYRGKELEQAVNILNRRWRDIDPDKLQPLITRVSSIVLRIK